jgi:hypothetical protein
VGAGVGHSQADAENLGSRLFGILVAPPFGEIIQGGNGVESWLLKRPLPVDRRMMVALVA